MKNIIRQLIVALNSYNTRALRVTECKISKEMNKLNQSGLELFEWLKVYYNVNQKQDYKAFDRACDWKGYYPYKYITFEYTPHTRACNEWNK